MSASALETLLGGISFVLTLFIFSYLLTDNLLYRLAVNILVGVTAGYASIVALEGVILPWFRLTLFAEETALSLRVLGVIPVLLGSFLVVKQLQRIARFGNIGIAFLVGVGAAVALVGAIVGTFVPLVNDVAENDVSWFNSLIMGLGTVTTLIMFQYLGKRTPEGKITRSRPMLWLAKVGTGFVAVTFGVIYAGILLSSLTVFSGVIAQQIAFILEQVN